LSNWDTSKVTDLSYTFSGASSFTGDGVSNWNTSKVISLDSTFQGATSFFGNVWRWNVQSVTDAENSFQNTPALRLCFKRFIYELWSVQGVNPPDEWSSISSCTWSLAEALDDVQCFGSPCTCTSIDPKKLRCLNCGRFSSLSITKQTQTLSSS
jgi:surface protein